MSSSEAGSSASMRRGLALALVLGAAALAGGCFRPLYAESTASTVGGSVRSALREIEVAEVKGIVGHYLRNELAFAFDGSGDAAPTKRFRLETTVTESLEVITVDYNNGRADSALLFVNAAWTLRRIGSGETVTSGTSMIRVPYERSTQRFATVRAARDAQVKAGKNLAELIRERIAASLVAVG
jgi:LPS-assembly lipoprotein